MIVIDANVAAKWYMPERGTEAALELLDSPDQLYAPELIRLEVLAAITRRVRKGESTVEEARSMRHDWFKHLHEGAVRLILESDVLQDATELSMNVRHTLQDCLYLAAATRLDAALITADRPFHDRVKPFYKKISMLPGCEKN
ncbi:MAG TPA: type II toxin-antitoxin system VapC family toxin [Gemmataceae bacterium]|nr:type II toxin-antitoxin system VapC family toxin [Gemmataceae bacterium]